MAGGNVGTVCLVIGRPLSVGNSGVIERRKGEHGMYVRLCMVDEAAEAGRISFLFETHGLHPFTVCPPPPDSTTAARPFYSIELPPDEIEKGRQVLALTARKAEKDLAQ